jgi:peptidoglycan/xylan/chitin deacetylase (PgdA/CDA1 family)
MLTLQSIPVLARVRGRPQLRIAAFGYHDVADDDTASGPQRRGARAYRFSMAEFRRQLDALERAGCTPGRVSDVDWSRPGTHVMLTFDDGGRSALDTAAELERRGWRGHFFITTGWLGRPSFLDGAAVRELHAAGHVIGSHSHTHPDIFRELAPAAMLREWGVSLDILSDVVGARVTAASVPGGDLSTEVIRSASEAGVRTLFTSEPRLVPEPWDGCRVLGRAILKRGCSPQQVARLALLSGWTQAGVERALKNTARRSLPAVYRQYVRVLAGE